MSLPKKFHKHIQWKDYWHEPIMKIPSEETIQGLAVIYFDKVKDDGDTGYAVPVRITSTSDKKLRQAGKDFAFRKLIKDFNLKLLKDSKIVKLPIN